MMQPSNNESEQSGSLEKHEEITISNDEQQKINSPTLIDNNTNELNDENTNPLEADNQQFEEYFDTKDIDLEDRLRTKPSTWKSKIVSKFKTWIPSSLFILFNL